MDFNAKNKEIKEKDINIRLTAVVVGFFVSKECIYSAFVVRL